MQGLAGVPHVSVALATGRGPAPANKLARRHPHMLNNRVEPLRWAKGAACMPCLQAARDIGAGVGTRTAVCCGLRARARCS